MEATIVFDQLFNKVMGFSGCEEILKEKGHVIMKTRVDKSDVNPYGKAHGGYLYTLCDDLAGYTGFTQGYYVVTMQASISYFKAGEPDDELTLESRCIFAGKKTQVVEISVSNGEQQLLVKASFTLYNVSKIED